MSDLTVALIGAGQRGLEVFAPRLADRGARLVAVADPDPARRRRAAAEYGLDPGACFPDADALLAQPRLADAAVIATPDRLHDAPAQRALDRGYHLLLEKPVATDEAGLSALADAARRAADEHGATVTVAHVLRYTAFFRRLRELVTGGTLGDLVGIEHAEDIAHWHFAHSYVRGNWRRQDQASPMLLAKACHDLDLLRWLAGGPCTRLASYADRVHFRAERAPPGAPPRCTDGCPAEETCPFSAPRFYRRRLAETGRAWPVSVLVDDPTPASLDAALEGGPYGVCVYRADNDVADHQVVALEFASGVRATLTVSAFTAENTRRLRLLGTRAEVRAEMLSGRIEVLDFLTGERRAHSVPAGVDSHGGGDDGLVEDFLARLRARKQGRDPGDAPTALAESLESHRMAFAAEAARRAGVGVDPSEAARRAGGDVDPSEA